MFRMINSPTVCRHFSFSHPDSVNDIHGSTPLDFKRTEFLSTNPPINLDVTSPDIIEKHFLNTHKANTHCLKCSHTGVLSDKQSVIHAAGSVIAYDPETFIIKDRNRNLLCVNLFPYFVTCFVPKNSCNLTLIV